MFNSTLIFVTGCSDWKLSKVNGFRTETVHIGKTKCVWKVIDFLKNCKQTSESCKQIFKNWEIYIFLSNAIWFYQHRIKYASLQIYILHPFGNFQLEHPVEGKKWCFNNLGGFQFSFLGISHLKMSEIPKNLKFGAAQIVQMAVFGPSKSSKSIPRKN